MASTRHATPFIRHGVFIFVAVSLILPMVNEGDAKIYDNTRNFGNEEKRLTREYHLRQGALRGLIVKPGRQYDLQQVEMFLGIPYAAAPVGSLRFMPPVSAPPWSGVKMATRFAPVCPQSLPVIKKGDPPSLGRQNYMNKLKKFLKEESEDCLYLNIYVPYREQKSKKFPVLVFIHGDSFEWSSGNPYDGRILAAYGNIMVITVNFRLGILGFVKPSLTEHEYGNNGLLDQLAALKWIKDNIEDLSGDPDSVTLMGHGTGAACVNFLMLSPISNALFHRAILMSGSALSDWAMTRDPAQYTLQVAQGLGCNPTSKHMMTCLQNKPLSDIKKVQILAREFETPLGPSVAGYFVPNEPEKTMESFPNLLSKYQLLSGVTELESYHDFGVIELDSGILENQRDDFIKKYMKITFEGAEQEAVKDILKQYSKSKADPQRWNVDTNRDVILDLFSDARTLAPMISFANYQSKANRQSYFYVFGHNSISTEYAALNKSVHGEEMPYVLGIPLGGANSHFHTEYTPQEKLLSEVVMRLWTNFVKNGSPNTQSVNEYYSLDRKQWSLYNVEWPEYTEAQQPYLRLDIPPSISSSYRKNFTKFWLETLPNKAKRYVIDPLFEYTSRPTTAKPKTTHRIIDPIRKIWSPQISNPPYYSTSYGKIRPISQPEHRPDTNMIYREIQSIKTPSRPIPPGLMEKVVHNTYTTTAKPTTLNNMPVKTSSATVTLIVTLGILFLAVNVGICAVLYFKKRRIRLRERTFETTHHSRADIGEVDVIGQKCSKEDKSALKTLKNSCSVIKTIGLNKMRGSTNSKKNKKKQEPCKTPKSDDSGGFRERFQLRRHLSTSTLDANTKVRDWITNEVMHRCSPNILRKSNSELDTAKSINVRIPFTRSEELLSDGKKNNKDGLNISDSVTPKNLLSKNYRNNKTKTSEKTTSTSALGSHSSIGSNKQSLVSKHTAKSNDSLKSKGTESIKSKKVSVAIDATPGARTSSVLKQEPIEFSKSLDYTMDETKQNKLQRSKTEGDFKCEGRKENENKTFTNVVTLSLKQETPLKISHKHSSSDPVTDVNYELLMREKMNLGANVFDILPPVTFRNNINVTSKDDVQQEPLSPEESLMIIKRRNFPKVLPDFPKAQKRLSLQPTNLQTFRNFQGNSENIFEKPKVPPQPPPRTTTLERRLAYQNSKPFSSFGIKSNTSNCEPKSVQDYENIESLPTCYDDFKNSKKSFESNYGINDHADHRREYPKVIIASSDVPSNSDTKILIQPSYSQVQISTNVPRVRLPDDFHSQTTGSIKSFTSICSDDNVEDEDDDFLEDLAEDKLIQELVGGVESPTSSVTLDSKGPETIFEKRLEIVPVKLNTVQVMPKEDYICVSDFFLPGISDTEKTAQIKPNFGLNKLQQRSESINKPLEKTVKVKQKKTINPTVILNKTLKSCKSDSIRNDPTTKLEHSNSGSSNDTETSTGTVKKVDLK
ncbi:Neuroligin-4, Y-linked [Papilio machaon]|uniref:Neuroligin-4, Y-linked n=1 Tax=Papilio machaon TaxID=76193 RepID=A0A0N1ICG6_PAPMA|nr:Neuroligin-4, Y-linked [Papilio machaon]